MSGRAAVAACMVCMIGLMIVAVGCRPGFEPPEGFVKLDRPGYLYSDRAVSADGVYLGRRISQDAAGGNLDFWSKAIGNELTNNRGYALESESQLNSADSVPGRRLDFVVRQNNADMAYRLAVWVHDDRVTVVEAGGPREALQSVEPQIEQFMREVLVK